jgi:hypothetical protein
MKSNNASTKNKRKAFHCRENEAPARKIKAVKRNAGSQESPSIHMIDGSLFITKSPTPSSAAIAITASTGSFRRQREGLDSDTLEATIHDDATYGSSSVVFNDDSTSTDATVTTHLPSPRERLETDLFVGKNTRNTRRHTEGQQALYRVLLKTVKGYVPSYSELRQQVHCQEERDARTKTLINSIMAETSPIVTLVVAGGGVNHETSSNGLVHPLTQDATHKYITNMLYRLYGRMLSGQNYELTAEQEEEEEEEAQEEDRHLSDDDMVEIFGFAATVGRPLIQTKEHREYPIPCSRYETSTYKSEGLSLKALEKRLLKLVKDFTGDYEQCSSDGKKETALARRILETIEKRENTVFVVVAKGWTDRDNLYVRAPVDVQVNKIRNMLQNALKTRIKERRANTKKTTDVWNDSHDSGAVDQLPENGVVLFAEDDRKLLEHTNKLFRRKITAITPEYSHPKTSPSRREQLLQFVGQGHSFWKKVKDSDTDDPQQWQLIDDNDRRIRQTTLERIAAEKKRQMKRREKEFKNAKMQQVQECYLRQNDVIFDAHHCQKTLLYQPGNIRMRVTIETFIKEFWDPNTTLQRKFDIIFYHVVQSTLNQGGRFVRLISNPEDKKPSNDMRVTIISIKRRVIDIIWRVFVTMRNGKERAPMSKSLGPKQIVRFCYQNRQYFEHLFPDIEKVPKDFTKTHYPVVAALIHVLPRFKELGLRFSVWSIIYLLEELGYTFVDELELDGETWYQENLSITSIYPFVYHCCLQFAALPKNREKYWVDCFRGLVYNYTYIRAAQQVFDIDSPYAHGTDNFDEFIEASEEIEYDDLEEEDDDDGDEGEEEEEMQY